MRAAIVAALAAGGWFGWQAWHQNGSGGPRYFTEPATVEAEIAERTTATGTLQPLVSVNVGAQVSGRIAKLHADFNQHVAAGTLLAEIDPTLVLAQIAQSRAGLAAAEANVARADAAVRNATRVLRRVQPLHAQGLSTKAELDQAEGALDLAQADQRASRAQVAQARAALEVHETNLGYTRIVSPIAGVVLQRAVDVGQTVAASLQAPTLFTIAQDLTQMQVHASVDEADVGKLRDEMPATFQVDAWPGEEFRGRLEQLRLQPTVQQNVVTYAAVISVDNPGERLRPGMTATVTFETRVRRNVIAVPNAALRWRPGQTDVVHGANVHRSRNLAQRGPRVPGGPTGPQIPQDLPATATATASGPRHKPSLVHVLRDGALWAVELTTGVTDGRTTEVVAGDIAPGDLLVVRKQAPEKPGGGGPGMPGGPPRMGGGTRRMM